jgi:hypothetical protein
LSADQHLVPVDRAVRVMHPLGAAFDNRLRQLLANGTVRLSCITDTVNPNARAFIVGPRAWNTDPWLNSGSRRSGD